MKKENRDKARLENADVYGNDKRWRLIAGWMDGWTGPLGLVFAVGGRREYERVKRSKTTLDNGQEETRDTELTGTLLGLVWSFWI